MVQDNLFSEGDIMGGNVNTSTPDRVNHCVPNQDAYWCSRCKCHSQFSYSISSSRNSQGTTTTETYRCFECGFRMFLPRVLKRWANGLIAFVFVAFCVVPFLEAQLGIEELIGSQGLVPCFMALGVFFGLLGAWMQYELIKWRVWSAKQWMKSQSELAREAEAHPHQPVYDRSNNNFDAWARQFIDPYKDGKKVSETKWDKEGNELK